MIQYTDTNFQNKIAVDPYDDRQRKSMGKLLWLIVDEYKLKTREVAAILDCSESSIKKHKHTNSLPKKGEFEIIRRLGNLLGIKKNLEILFPNNPEVKANWLHRKRRIFKDQSAIGMIMEDRLNAGPSLFTIRRVLDMARNGTINDLT